MTVRIKEDRRNGVSFAIIDDLGGNTEKALRDALSEIGQETKREIKRLIKDPPKTGLHHAELPNQSSAPGQAPADQFGDLRKGVQYRTRGSQQVTVGDTVEYGLWLEEGTRFMRPRPHVERAVDNKAKDTMQSLFSHTNRLVLTK